MVGKDVNAKGNEWIPLHFTECKQDDSLDKIISEIRNEQNMDYKCHRKTYDNCLRIIDKYKAESSYKESIPYLMHKEMGVPLSECQKAYDVAIEYLRNKAKLKG